MSVRPDERVDANTLRSALEVGAEAVTGERTIQSPRPPSEPPPSSAFGTLDTERFVQRAVMGEGGTGVVIRAFDRNLLRDVAIKVLSLDRGEASEVERFTEEACISGQLEHPNIVPVYELGVDRRGRRFMCMKLVEGMTLEEALERAGGSRLASAYLARFLQVFVKVCDAVSFAHSRGVIHRDLKPKNVMISDFGQVYVLDWGIARLRPRPAGHRGPWVQVNSEALASSQPDPPGAFLGTACYMAPEQIRGQHDRVDERTDVFALGASLYQILTGRPPLTPEIVRSIWMHGSSAPIAAPQQTVAAAGGGVAVPPELARIALRALAFEPADRYASAQELQRDVEAFQRGAWDAPQVRFAAGTTILREGEPGDSAYLIVEGQCIAYRIDGAREVELRVMGPGEVFGETAIFSDKPRSASIRACTDVTLIAVTREALSSALGLNSWMGAFVKALADRFREVDERLRTATRQG
jgi:serine/threonine-protein kinase